MGGADESPSTGNRLGASGLRLEYAVGGSARASLGRDAERSPYALRLGTELESGDAAVDGSGEPGGYIVTDHASRFREVSAYAEAEARFGPLLIAPGLRAVHRPTHDETLLEPRAAARLEVGEMALTVGYAHAHQMLSTARDDRFSVPGAPIWFAHASEWPLSRSVALTAEIEGWVETLWQWRAAVYTRELRNVPRWRPVGERSLESMAFDDGTAEGVEVSLRRHGERIGGWISYGLSRTELTEGESGRSYYAAWDRRHALDFALFLRVWRDVSFSVRTAYGSGMPFWPESGRLLVKRFDPLHGRWRVPTGPDYPVWADVQDRYPDYFRIDIGARDKWTVRGFEIEPYVSVLNLTARKNVLFYTLVPNGFGYWGAPPESPPDLKPELQIPIILFPSIGFDLRF